LRNEFRRVILAFATRTASVLVVGFCFSFDCGTFFNFPAVGIKGKTGVATFAARSTGCVLIGPVIGVRLDMLDNSISPKLFMITDHWN
jgi:hypothetical protein